MRWFPLLLLLPGCVEYGLNLNVPNPDPGPGLSPGESGPRDPDDPLADDPSDPLRGDYDPSSVSLVGLLTEAPSGADGEDGAVGAEDAPEDWWNQPWTEPPAGTDPGGEGGEGGTPHGGLARMTGGGGFAGDFGHGFTIHCEETHDANSMTVDLPGQAKFKLDGVAWIVCLDDPALDAQQPEPDFDTVVGVGWGTLRGHDADVWFVFTDDGEPGTDDHADLEIVQGSDAWSGAGFLTQGNHQVHDPVGQ